MAVRVVLEAAPKRTFASALDWPGWSRGGRTPDAALDNLAAYAPRYARVAERAGRPLPPVRSPDELDAVERVEGGGGTEFGVPGVPASSEDAAMDPAELAWRLALLQAAWAELDRIAAEARGHELRKGPRGGGRDLDKILGHVREAEAAYLGQLGARPPRTEHPDALRAALLDTLDARVTGRPIENPRRTKSPWSPRYAIRRAAWHVLDHAWEIEDRVQLTPGG